MGALRLSFCLYLQPCHVMLGIMMTVFLRLLHPCFVFMLIARNIKLYTPGQGGNDDQM